MFGAIVRNPASYVTAALTIATGIGAVVAMFSIYAAFTNGDGRAEQLAVLRVSASFFDVLRIAPRAAQLDPVHSLRRV